MAKTDLTAQRLREFLHYDPETGIFYRRHDARRWKAGTPIGTTNRSKRQYIPIGNKFYLAHRLAWMYMTGEWPDMAIDHKDGNPHNNRFANLRNVSTTVNAQNLRKAKPQSKTGILGVHKNGRFIRSMITVNKKKIHLGYFSNVEDAQNAYLAAKRKLHEGCTI